jgi:glycosyltransferase involved in cell wall biosynthesis
MALASGTPVIAIEDERSSALAGPAAYLVKGEDSRLLGAALITVLVEEELAGRLAQAGRQRAATWSQQAFAEGLAKAYATITN